MSAQEIYEEATRRGLRLEPRGGNLAVIPGDGVAPDFVGVLREHKAEILDWLARPTCPGWLSIPPDDLPLTTEMPRPAPRDRERMIGYLLRQGCYRPSPLTAWLLRRECAYYDGPGRHWDCEVFAYAAARDAACWQLRRTERDVLDLIAGFEPYG